MEDEREGFEVFYRAWPRKIARADAFKAWQQTRAARPRIADLLEAIARLMTWREQLAKRRDFVPALPYPATWLRGERWADEFDTPAVAATAAPGNAEAQAQWCVLRAALAADDPRTLTDHRTRHAMQQIGWPTLRAMRQDQVLAYSREFERHFGAAPVDQPRAQLVMFPTQNTVRKVANG